MKKSGSFHFRLRAALLILMIACGTAEVFGQYWSTARGEEEAKKLEAAVAGLVQKQRDLEARVAALERLNLAPSPELVRQSYISSCQDAMISQMVSILANAYQYRIRPQTMGGGGGSYQGYKIPRNLTASEFGTFVATV